MALHELKKYLDHPYRQLLDVLAVMSDIVAKLDLDMDDLPNFTTLCYRKQELKMTNWRSLLSLSAEFRDHGEVQAIDATSVGRHATSQHYANRTNYTFKTVKTTALIDCDTNAILDIHFSMRQLHDTQVGRQVFTRNIENLGAVVANKGYDWANLRRELRENGVRPVIKHREFTPLDAAYNTRIDDTTYHIRSNAESTFFALRRRFGGTLRSRTWLDSSENSSSNLPSKASNRASDP